MINEELLILGDDEEYKAREVPGITAKLRSTYGPNVYYELHVG